MKKILTIIFCLTFCFVAFAIASAGDVTVPHALIKTIPGYDHAKPVYAASDDNGWFVSGPDFATNKAKRAAEMKKIGDKWTAPGVLGKRFHPVQLAADGKPQWAKIEEVYDLKKSPYVDLSAGENKPCLLIKK